MGVGVEPLVLVNLTFAVFPPSIVAENGLTCLMVTHNMQSALELGNRTIMMDAGRVVMDVSGVEREALEMADLLLRFKEISGKALNNDRMLLI